jgi:release factor glutamine methyltransferase
LIEGLDITTLDGVYPPSEDTFLLIDVIKATPVSGKALELCCGSGLVGLSTVQRLESIVAVDLNPTAIRNTKINYRRNGFAEKLEGVVGDLFSPLRPSLYDLIIMNPPYLVDELEGSEDLSWSGGSMGRELIDRFISGVKDFMADNGKAFFLQSDSNGIEESIERIRASGMDGSVACFADFQFERLVVIELQKCRTPKA